QGVFRHGEAVALRQRQHEQVGVERLHAPRSRAAGSSALTASSVSASAAGLSVRQRRMRGKRTATPDLCRGDGWTPSKASSNTSSGRTERTGPNVSTVWPRTNASTLRISASVSPEYALATG